MNRFAGKKILIVDSSAFVCAAIKAEFESLGATVEKEASSDSALMKTIRWRPDLLISAVEVGRINGFDLCLILKLIPEFAGLPVVIMSSNEADLTLKKASDAGADHYVQKNAELIAHLRQIAMEILVPNPASVDRQRTPKGALQTALVVDDSYVMRKVISNILKQVGINDIHEAENGVAALDQLKKNRPDFIMTDWNMPEMSGIELIRKIRETPDYDSIPIAMVTTETGQQEVNEAKSAGANAHLCKPFSVESMKKMISTLQTCSK